MIKVAQRMQFYLEMVRFSHTIFALPFALMSALVAAQGLPAWNITGWILVCMVGARTAAMTFNRIVDRHIDFLNPRTKDRHIPSGKVSLLEAVLLCVFCSGLFIWGAWKLNPLAFALSFPALLVLFGYSFMKRFTSFCHAALGLSLAIAPVGAWIAVTGAFSWQPMILAIGVMLWVTGFDVLYALLDEEFDQKTGIHSMVVRLGKAKAMQSALVLHVFSIIFIFLFGITTGLGWFYFMGAAFYAGLILYEHSLVSPEDISQVNMAFFNVNGAVSMGLLLFTSLDIWLQSL